jgi:hypothetical protein
MQVDYILFLFIEPFNQGLYFLPIGRIGTLAKKKISLKSNQACLFFRDLQLVGREILTKLIQQGGIP